jgi:hypothetical protein
MNHFYCNSYFLRGILRSVAKYFSEQPNGTAKINFTKFDTGEYYSIRNLYYDMYGKWFCTIDLGEHIEYVFQPNVAKVDLDAETADLPYAHFDAEKFYESNQRVISFTNQINQYLANKNFIEAAKLTGQIMHTIQDFYSHSNWIESGNTDINFKIGNESFFSLPVATQSDNLTCVGNCTLVNVECTAFFSSLSGVIQSIGFSSSSIKCPIRYYKCSGNLVKLDKLVSGYYVNQKLPDGSTVSKPDGAMKCSHGGIVDGDMFKPATGGINKDSG